MENTPWESVLNQAARFSTDGNMTVTPDTGEDKGREVEFPTTQVRVCPRTSFQDIVTAASLPPKESEDLLTQLNALPDHNGSCAVRVGDVRKTIYAALDA